MMEVKIKKLQNDAIIPEYKMAGDAGLDLTAISKKYYSIYGEEVSEFATSIDDLASSIGYVEYGTGLAIEIPDGFVGLVFPRSSISYKHLLLSNSVGVIDSGYRGEIVCGFTWPNLTDSQDPINPGLPPIEPVEEYEIGDRIAQLIILPYPKITLKEADELSTSDRGNKGFGSTNNI